MKQQPLNLSTGEIFRQINQKNVFASISTRELAESILLFLASRIIFMDYLISPFGVALFSALFYRRKRISYVLFGLLGVASAGLPLFFFKYAGAILIICTVQLIFRKELEHKKRTVALISTASIFVNGGIYVMFEGFFTFDALLLVLECAICCGSFFIFDKGLFLTKRRISATPVEMYELVCALFLPATGILSVGLTESFEPLAHVAATFIILFAALTRGAVACVSAGAIFGLALGVGTSYPAQLVCIYTLSSLFCGILHPFGRLVVSGAFGAVSLLTTYLLCPEANGILTVSYVGAACLLLYFVPDKMLIRLATLSTKPRKEAALSYKISQAVSDKISEIKDTTQSVSTIFYEVIDSLRNPFYETTSAVLEATADAVCSGCSLCRFCWHKDRKSTLDVVERMCLAMEKKTVFSNKDIPEDFSDMCIRSEAFAAELSKNLESFRVSKMWSGKLLESKRLVAEQFKNISMILEDTKKSIDAKIAFLPEAERRICSEFNKFGICAENISVYTRDGYYIEMDIPSCDGKTMCDSLIPSVLSEVLDVPVVRMTADCEKLNCRVAFCEKPKFTTDIATASATKRNSDSSGDSLCCFSPDCGKIAIVLCDGMGSGEHANYQSSIATELCKKLMASGFGKETCVRLINDILLTGADRESFSTMDMCILNLYTAKAEFIKAGAPASRIIQGDRVTHIEGASLPVGMLSDIEPDMYSYAVQSGDCIVLATDGITDALNVSDEDEMENLCLNFGGNAQELADKILNRALALSQNLPTDDMTVVVCKVFAEQ